MKHLSLAQAASDTNDGDQDLRTLDAISVRTFLSLPSSLACANVMFLVRVCLFMSL